MSNQLRQLPPGCILLQGFYVGGMRGTLVYNNSLFPGLTFCFYVGFDPLTLHVGEHFQGSRRIGASLTYSCIRGKKTFSPLSYIFRITDWEKIQIDVNLLPLDIRIGLQFLVRIWPLVWIWLAQS